MSAEPLSPAELIFHAQQARVQTIVDSFLNERADQRHMREVLQRIREETRSAAEAIRLDTTVSVEVGELVDARIKASFSQVSRRLQDTEKKLVSLRKELKGCGSRHGAPTAATSSLPKKGSRAQAPTRGKGKAPHRSQSGNATVKAAVTGPGKSKQQRPASRKRSMPKPAGKKRN